MVELEGSELSHDKCCDLCAVTAPNPMPMCGVDALSCVLVLAASVGLIFLDFSLIVHHRSLFFQAVPPHWSHFPLCFCSQGFHV